MPADELIAVITSGLGRVFAICALIPLSEAIIASIPDLIRAGVFAGLPVELLQWFAYRPATRQQLARRFGETAVERSESLERDLNLGTRVDEIIMVKSSTVRNGTHTHHRTGLERSDELQPGEHVFGLVADLGC